MFFLFWPIKDMLIKYTSHILHLSISGSSLYVSLITQCNVLAERLTFQLFAGCFNCYFELFQMLIKYF